MSQTVLITGGSGYIGGRIVQSLMQDSRWRVRIGTHSGLHSQTAKTTQTGFVRVDMCSRGSLQQACVNVDAIIHLAGINDAKCAADPTQALLVNSLGTLHLLHAAEAAGVKRFIYFSTAHVYGSPLAGAIHEQNVTRPVNPYAISHRAAEDFVLSAHDRGALAGIVVRLSNAYGPPVHAESKCWSLVVNDLCNQAVCKRRLSLRSTGLQRRDFVAMNDVCMAAEHLLTLPRQELGDGLFNLGGDNAMRIIDLAELVAERCSVTFGFRPEIRRAQPVPGEPSNELRYRISKLIATGFHLSGNALSEIDETLRLCRTAFEVEQR